MKMASETLRHTVSIVGSLLALFLFTMPYSLLAQEDCVVTISGNVYYSGTQTGVIRIAIGHENDQSWVAETSISAPGPYKLSFTHSPSLPLKTYFVMAQMDVNNSGSISPESFQQDEPTGNYSSPCAGKEFPEGCEPIKAIDIFLSDYKQEAVLLESFEPDYFSGYDHDMDYHDGYLWICDQTMMPNGPDVHKVNPENGQLVESYDLNNYYVTSLQWIGNDMWVCFKGDTSWVIRQYIFNGTSFTQGMSCDLPSSMDRDIVWSINIAWDSNLLWVQEKGPCGNIYKMNLSNCTIVETISANNFKFNKALGTADYSDICFSDGYLWAMNDDSPKFFRYDPSLDLINSGVVNYTFIPRKATGWEHVYWFEEDDIEYKYNGMVKYGDLIYFLQRSNTDNPQYKILVASLVRPDIKANDSDGPITMSSSKNLSLTVELDSRGNMVDCDWWLLANANLFGIPYWYHRDLFGTWLSGIVPTVIGPLADVSPPYEVLNFTGLPPGIYTFYFGVDTNMNGIIDLKDLVYDDVTVIVNP